MGISSAMIPMTTSSSTSVNAHLRELRKRFRPIDMTNHLSPPLRRGADGKNKNEVAGDLRTSNARGRVVPIGGWLGDDYFVRINFPDLVIRSRYSSPL